MRFGEREGERGNKERKKEIERERERKKEREREKVAGIFQAQLTLRLQSGKFWRKQVAEKIIKVGH